MIVLRLCRCALLPPKLTTTHHAPTYIQTNTPNQPLTDKDDPRLIHSGFKAAFDSVLENVYHCIEMVIGQGKDLAADGWTVSARAPRV